MRRPYTKRYTLADRFKQKLSAPTERGCIEWASVLSRSGYGRITDRKDGVKLQLQAHRVAWEIANGPIPEGMVVCHKCDNRRCVNVEHLFIGTMSDNMRDMVSKGRDRANRVRGERVACAALTAESVVVAREMVASGQSRRAVAKALGVSHTCVTQAVARKSWAHIK